MLHTSQWLRRSIAVLTLVAFSAVGIHSHSDASPATYPSDESTEHEALNGDWPW